MRLLFLFSFLCLLLSAPLAAQPTRLAQQYFADGEYEKAAQLYEQLFEENGNNDFFFDRYLESLLALERYDEGEKAIKKQLKRTPANSRLYVSYGRLQERQFEPEKAKAQYKKAIENLGADQYSVTSLANTFVQQTMYEEAIATYERGAQLMDNKRVFAYNLGDLYRRKGDLDKMVESYLDAIEDNPRREEQIRTMFQRYLGDDGLRVLQRELYSRIQKDADSEVFPEMLAWVFVQRKDYKGALRQVRALDKRKDENGTRVFQLAMIAMNDKDYATTIDALDYIIDEKGTASTYYLDAKRESLRAQRMQLTDGFDFKEKDLRRLENNYRTFITEFGTNAATAPMLLELAELEALYLNDLPAAIGILDTMTQLPGVNPTVRAEGKISLGDYYLMTGDNWEATLLYSQVDKEFKEDRLGHEARFRNARLSYFRGDFEWAQAQFDVLKASTSKLIANDALDLSVFIIGNMGLDTTTTPMQTYADAELLVFQNRFDEAFATLDQLLKEYPNHELTDDVLYLKGNIYTKQRQYESAILNYQRVVQDFPKSIRADNSLYKMAQLYETRLDDKPKAQELYETLFIDFSNSVLAVEARKRFRVLRGDDVQ